MGADRRCPVRSLGSGQLVRNIGLLILSAVVLSVGLDSSAEALPTSAGSGRSWDVAASVNVPGLARFYNEPVVVGDLVFVMEQTSQSGRLWRLDLQTAELTMLVEFAPEVISPTGLSTDGTDLLVATGATYSRYSVDGILLWETALPEIPNAETVFSLCLPPVFGPDLMFVACTVVAQTLARGVFVQQNMDVVMAFRGSEPEAVWSRSRGLREVAGSDSGEALPAAGNPTYPNSGIHAASYGDGLLVVSILDRATGTQLGCPSQLVDADTAAQQVQLVWALEANTGDDRWEWRAPKDVTNAAPANMPRLPAGVAIASSELQYALNVIVDGPRVYAKGVSLFSLDAKNGCMLSRLPPPIDSGAIAPSAVLVMDEDSLFVTYGSQLYSLGRGTFDLQWRRGSLTQSEFFRADQGGVFVDDFVLTMTQTAATTQDTPGRVLLQSRLDGSLALSLDFNPFTYNYMDRPIGVSSDYVVIDGGLSNVMVFGQAPAGIQIVAKISDDFPAVNASVRVDLSETIPGRQDPTTEFIVDWGDGSASGRSAETVAEHTYPTAGDYELKIEARNGAGQNATRTFVVHVGASKPTPPGFFARAFSKEQQETTYFVLGLGITFLTAVGGLIFPLSKTKARIFGGRKEPKGPSRGGKRRK